MRRLNLDSRKDLTAVTSKRYQKARKKDKGKILGSAHLTVAVLPFLIRAC